MAKRFGGGLLVSYAAGAALLSGGSTPVSAAAPAGLGAWRLRCEHGTEPLSVNALRPRLSWKLASKTRGQRQTAYEIWVSDDPDALKADVGNLWDSGKVESSASIGIVYAGAPLHSGEECWWKVRVWDRDGNPSKDSDIAHWQMGLLAASDWKAQWIAAQTPRSVPVGDLDLPPCAYLRRTFALTKPVRHAILYVTARGVYEMHLNGKRVGDAVLGPGWTDYKKRIQYQAFDVTSSLRHGDNAIGAIIGDGWYSGYVGFGHQRNNYGSQPQLLSQIVIDYADGSRDTISTDDAWQGGVGPIVYSDMLMGERYDARKELDGWDTPGFEASGWTPVLLNPKDATTAPVALVGSQDPPVRVTQEIKPIAVTQLKSGAYLYDMGQNMVGWARLKVRGDAGAEITMRFGEMLNPEGTLYTTNLRAARSIDTYVCRGDGEETFEPHFTFHGFRYVEVSGFPSAPDRDAVTGCVVGSDIPLTGTFVCSSPMVNQLQHNIDWGQRGNFLSVPTDCPQRDERLGWMGDAQIFVRTATYNRDVAAFFEKWMHDVEDAQSADGGFPDVAPRLADLADGAPAWGDAGVIVPWTIYQAYGDTEILRQSWPAMTRWMDYLTSANPDGLWNNRRNNDFGDWLSIAADTPKDVLATAYYGYDASLMAKIARVLGKTEDAARYDALFEHIKSAFGAAYITPDGRIKGDTQTCYVVALRFGLMPDALRAAAAKHLTEDIAGKNHHLSTGFVGVGYLCPVLTEAGYNDIAYTLLLNETFPSWGYSIKQGATTIWERWDGWTSDKGFQDPGMNSFNHYALGSVGQWLYQYVAGIDTDPDQPGYKHILMHPRPGPGLTSARADFDSAYGTIVSDWKIEGGKFKWDITIPANTTATVWVPNSDVYSVTEGGRNADSVEGVTPLGAAPGFSPFEVQSGSYHFEAALQ